MLLDVLSFPEFYQDPALENFPDKMMDYEDVVKYIKKQLSK